MQFTALLALLSAVASTSAATVLRQNPFDRSSLQNPLGNQDGRGEAETKGAVPHDLGDVLDALSAMQDTYFNIFAGTWPTAIDWTAAVMATQVSAALSSLITGLTRTEAWQDRESCVNLLGWENVVNKYFAQITTFYYGENAFGLRAQAYDDMLWVVLEWLENIKFMNVYSSQRWKAASFGGDDWYGLEFSPLAAHRARIFYELAEHGWDETLCHGGMIWNPVLDPYKNTITNELFMSASIAMYLYFPGDNNTSPYAQSQQTTTTSGRRNPVYLANAIKAYKWLSGIHMINDAGLYADGYHITGWHKYPNGTIDPGTGQCDELEKMVYTYNQGVILSASRNLWLATGSAGYLDDAHRLVANVIHATGWPSTSDRTWHGLGRGGVLEEFCDRAGTCSQDGQTFKGIFFHHLAEFCRPLWPAEKAFRPDRAVYEAHLARCEAYGDWVRHNADAALVTRDARGLFGMWWGAPVEGARVDGPQALPEGAHDYRNPPGVLPDVDTRDPNDRGRGRTVETQSGGLAVLRARWQWKTVFGRRSSASVDGDE